MYFLTFIHAAAAFTTSVSILGTNVISNDQIANPMKHPPKATYIVMLPREKKTAPIIAAMATPNYASYTTCHYVARMSSD